MARIMARISSQALGYLDPSTLGTFSTALHGSTSDPDIINTISSQAPSSVIPVLTGKRGSLHGTADTYDMRGEDSAMHMSMSQTPLSPRLHSLPDNVLSPLGLLAEASLQNTESKKGMGQFGKAHRPSPLGIERQGYAARNGNMSPNYRMATSDVRGGEGGDDEKNEAGRGVASQNYFRPGVSPPTVSTHDQRVPELLTLVTREEINELFEIFFTNSESFEQYDLRMLIDSHSSRPDSISRVPHARCRPPAIPVPPHRHMRDCR